jgi:hypothetical protein
MHSLRSRRAHDRGNAILITLVVTLALLALSIGVLQFSAHERSSSAALRRREQLANCALAVQQYIGSQLRFPDSLSITSLSFTIPGSAGNIVLAGGHYNNTETSVTQFAIGNAANGVSTPVQDLANNVRVNSGG